MHIAPSSMTELSQFPTSTGDASPTSDGSKLQETHGPLLPSESHVSHGRQSLDVSQFAREKFPHKHIGLRLVQFW